MPKTKESTREFLQRIVGQHPKVFRVDDSVLFCTVCDSSVNADQLFLVKQHLKTAKHTKAAEKKKREMDGTSQSLLTAYQAESASSSKLNDFNMKLTTMMLTANIPLYKVSNTAFREFLEEFTKFSAPAETTLRSNYLPVIYEKKMDRMRSLAADNYIWVSIDETTDVEQRYIIHFIFGVLGVEEEKDRCYLFSMAELDKVNNITVGNFFIDSLNLLWPTGLLNHVLHQFCLCLMLIRNANISLFHNLKCRNSI